MPRPIPILPHTNFRSQQQKFVIKSKDRSRHIYIIGKTGAGKTTLPKNLAAQDIQNGSGLSMIDPRGEFAEEVKVGRFPDKPRLC